MFEDQWEECIELWFIFKHIYAREAFKDQSSSRICVKSWCFKVPSIHFGWTWNFLITEKNQLVKMYLELELNSTLYFSMTHSLILVYHASPHSDRISLSCSYFLCFFHGKTFSGKLLGNILVKIIIRWHKENQDDSKGSVKRKLIKLIYLNQNPST